MHWAKTVGVIQTDMSREQRRASYACDITYGTMKEFGFDFLRDHSYEREQKEQLVSAGGGHQASVERAELRGRPSQTKFPFNR